MAAGTLGRAWLLEKKKEWKQKSEENELSMRTACKSNILVIQKLRIVQNLILKLLCGFAYQRDIQILVFCYFWLSRSWVFNCCFSVSLSPSNRIAYQKLKS